MPSRLSRLRRHVKTHGARRTALEIGHRLRRLAYTEQQLIVLVKDLDAIVEPPHPGDVRLEDLAGRHLPELAQLNRRRGQPQADRRFARYLEQGFHCFLAYLGEEMIGYLWWVDREAKATFPDLRRLGLGIELGEGDVYGSDFFLLEEHRGAGAGADFFCKFECGLRDRGYRRLWGYVLSDNRPARWLYSMRGHMPMWRVNRRRVLFVWRSTREAK